MSTLPQKPFPIQYQCYGIGYLKYKKNETDPLFQCFGYKKIIKDNQNVSHVKEVQSRIKEKMIFNDSSQDDIHSFTKSPLFLQRRDICLGCLYFSSNAVYQPKCLGGHFILLQEKVQKCDLNDSYKSFNESPSLESQKKKKDIFFFFSYFNKLHYRTQELFLHTKSLIELRVLNDFQNFPTHFYQRIQFLPLRSLEILKKCVKSSPKN